MKGTSWVAVLLVIVLGSVIGIAGGTFLAGWLPVLNHMKLSEMVKPAFSGKRYIRILMIGQDNTGGGRKGGYGLSDTLVVFAMDTQTKDIRAISIPRDTRVEVPGHGTCKINAAHAFGGPNMSRQVIDDLLGTKIDYYVKTTTSGLRNLVDELGGVYIKIDKDMHYVDRHGGLYINLKAGPDKQLLNGKQAEGFVRFRHDAFGDSGFTMENGKRIATGRIVRQQLFLRALANRILSLPTKRERAKILQEALDKKYIFSDLSLKDWNELADMLKDIDPQKIAMSVLPGAPGNLDGVSYWLPDSEKIGPAVAQYIYFQGKTSEEDPKIEVLNGSGIAGAAIKVADKLKKAGFDVTRTDNASSFNYNQSCVISHKGKGEPVQRIAKLLRCEDIREESKSGDSADITVIVGRNYNE